MLLSLHIENIAVIEQADISFREGLNVLTGETGAGKSIIIDALHAVTGARVSREIVRTGASRGLVSASFDAEDADAWCAENEIEPEDGLLIITRIISKDGKTSCRVNGIHVTTAQLRDLGSFLVDIHGQNDGRQLMDESTHIRYLDAYAGLDLSSYSQIYLAYKDKEEEIRAATDEADSRRLLAESLQFRVQELEKAALREGEEQELESRSMLLRNSERLREAVSEAYECLYGGDASAIDLTGTAQGCVSRASAWSPDLVSADHSLKEAEALLRDTAELLRDTLDSLDFSPEEFDTVENRLSQLKRLEKKFGASDESELIKVYRDAQERLSGLVYSEEALEELKAERDRLREKCEGLAAALSLSRKSAAVSLSERVERVLSELSMPSARFRVMVDPRGGSQSFGPEGADHVVFLVSANAGEDPDRISKTASGGELSRIMLAVKSVFGEIDPVPTAVFDEIDTGVSGKAANRVAEKLSDIGRSRQVLCVSHLPQIAAMADAQFCIEKSERDGRTFTTVLELDRDGRRKELARLSGGDSITDLTLASAEELLADADRRKEQSAHAV